MDSVIEKGKNIANGMYSYLPVEKGKDIANGMYSYLPALPKFTRQGQMHHVVCFKFKEGVTQEQVDDLKKGLHSLRDIPGVNYVECGRNFTNRADVDYCVTVALKDKETLQSYAQHPKHQDVLTSKIAPIKKDVIAMDFEFEK